MCIEASSGSKAVLHRIGDLELQIDTERQCQTVIHRIDDLELTNLF